MFNVDNMQKYLYTKYLHTYSYSLIHIMVKQHTQWEQGIDFDFSP